MKKRNIDPPVTCSEFLKAISKLPTKDDLKNFITKDDAKNFATKADLKNFITKDDLKIELKNFTTKDDLKNELKNFTTKDEFNKLVHEVVNIKFELKALAVSTKEDIKNSESRILNAIDAFSQKSENYDRKALFHSSRIENHEERITKLEKVA